LVQVASPDDELPEQRRERILRLLQKAPRCDLYVLPELWAPAYFSFEYYAERAETVTGPTLSMLSQFARDSAAYVHVGSFLEDCDNGMVSNTAAFLDPRGTVVIIYANIRVFGLKTADAELLVPGESLSVVDTR